MLQSHEAQTMPRCHVALPVDVDHSSPVHIARMSAGAKVFSGAWLCEPVSHGCISCFGEGV